MHFQFGGLTYDNFQNIFSADTIEELYASLARKSSDIYVKRSRLLYANTPMRTKLFTWTMKDLDIIAMADMSFHGKENVIKNMKEIDPDRLVHFRQRHNSIYKLLQSILICLFSDSKLS